MQQTKQKDLFLKGVLIIFIDDLRWNTEATFILDFLPLYRK